MKFRTGNGATWLDLLQTLSGRYRAEQADALPDPAALRAWLKMVGLEPTGAITDADVDLVTRTREALHRTTVAALQGAACAAGDLRLLERALDADTAVRPRRAPDGLRLTRPATAAQALARLVRDGVVALAGPERAYVHRCGDGTCSGIFIDHSGRRRWCSDQSCGNRVRVCAHRARAGG